jgi:hypothetical protein
MQVVVSHVVEDLNGQFGSCAAQRVTQRNGASVSNLLLVAAELLDFPPSGSP